MRYEIEELVPLVAELAEKYTSFESTSITYERAEQLMKAVIYCIRELEQSEASVLEAAEKIPAGQAYQIGYELAGQKVQRTLELYHEIMSGFHYYDNHCLYDTLVKGMPEFFKRYDIRYAPQDELLTLDYPVLRDLSGYEGVDRIYEYIRCIYIEQRFLKEFPVEYVREILIKYDSEYEDMIENICEIILLSVFRHISVGKLLGQMTFSEEEHRRAESMFKAMDAADVRSRFLYCISRFIKERYENAEEIMNYISIAAEDIAVRITQAAENNTLYL